MVGVLWTNGGGKTTKSERVRTKEGPERDGRRGVHFYEWWPSCNDCRVEEVTEGNCCDTRTHYPGRNTIIGRGVRLTGVDNCRCDLQICPEETFWENPGDLTHPSDVPLDKRTPGDPVHSFYLFFRNPNCPRSLSCQNSSEFFVRSSFDPMRLDTTSTFPSFLGSVPSGRDRTTSLGRWGQIGEYTRTKKTKIKDRTVFLC